MLACATADRGLLRLQAQPSVSPCCAVDPALARPACRRDPRSPCASFAVGLALLQRRLRLGERRLRLGDLVIELGRGDLGEKLARP